MKHTERERERVVVMIHCNTWSPIINGDGNEQDSKFERTRKGPRLAHSKCMDGYGLASSISKIPAVIPAPH